MTSPDRRKSAAKAPPARRYRRETAAGARRYRRETAARPPRDRRETAARPRRYRRTTRLSRLSRVASGYLESTSGYLEPLKITWRQGCLGAGPGCLERFRLSRGRLELSRAARLSREGSGYLERSGYLEGGVGTTRASRWLGPLRMTRSAQDDSVRYETSHVLRHCKEGIVGERFKNNFNLSFTYASHF